MIRLFDDFQVDRETTDLVSSLNLGFTKSALSKASYGSAGLYTFILS
jgi:hypothetical protein